MTGFSPGCRDSANKVLARFKMDEFKDEPLRDAIAEELQNKFDLGCKAAGGTISDIATARDKRLVELAIDQQEVDAVLAAVDAAMLELFTAAEQEPLIRFRDKIALYRSRKGK